MNIAELNKIEIGGTIFISALAHELNFEDGSVLKSNPALANDIFCAEEVTDWDSKPPPTKQAKYAEEAAPFVEKVILQYKTPRYEPSTEGTQFLREYVFGAKNKTLIVTSIIGAQAFGKGTVSPACTVETARKHPSQKIVLKYKWHAF